MEKYKKVLRLVEERNWKEMEEWLHDDFMYIKETVLMDREEHVQKMEKEFGSKQAINQHELLYDCLLYTSPSPRDRTRSRMPSSA